MKPLYDYGVVSTSGPASDVETRAEVPAGWTFILRRPLLSVPDVSPEGLWARAFRRYAPRKPRVRRVSLLFTDGLLWQAEAYLDPDNPLTLYRRFFPTWAEAIRWALDPGARSFIVGGRTES